MADKSEKTRHILALSGGKDSAALAVYLKDKIPNLEYVFLDTGHELPETHSFLDRMEAILGIRIERLKPKKDFRFWLGIFGGCLPSPQNRWCTRLLKIVPYEQYIGDDQTRSYIALRADEDRTGYISHKQNVVPIYPFIEDGLTKQDIYEILENSGLGFPGYYSWRSRSGCYFCFFQRRVEWVRLANEQPDCFECACEFESNHADGRTYTWIEGKSLRELLKEADRILEEDRLQEKDKVKLRQPRKLGEQLSHYEFTFAEGSILDGVINDAESVDDKDQGSKPCLICTL